MEQIHITISNDFTYSELMSLLALARYGKHSRDIAHKTTSAWLENRMQLSINKLKVKLVDLSSALNVSSADESG